MYQLQNQLELLNFTISLNHCPPGDSKRTLTKKLQHLIATTDSIGNGQKVDASLTVGYSCISCKTFSYMYNINHGKEEQLKLQCDRINDNLVLEVGSTGLNHMIMDRTE